MINQDIETINNLESRLFLTFSISETPYALPIDYIREIIEFTSYTVLPSMPAFLRGLINLRGTVIPVIDLQARFGKSVTEIKRRTCIIIIELNKGNDLYLFGLIVDSVSEVMNISATRIGPAPSFGTNIRPDFIEGIINLDTQFILALNLQQVLSIDELGALIGIKNEEVIVGKPQTQ